MRESSVSRRVPDGAVCLAPAFRLGYRPELDGLRGLAVLVVLAFHCPLLSPVVCGGFFGVDLFLVLSGFLITCLLVEEHGSSGAIDLKRFYARRALRLLPALWVLLGVCYLFALRTHVPGEGKTIFQALPLVFCCAGNFYWVFPVNLHILGHTWSLGLEEQFYFVWPVLLALLLRWRVRRRWLLLLVCVGILASASLRAMVFRGPDTLSYHIATTSLATRADALLVGCLVGLLACWNCLPRQGRGHRALQVAGGASALLLGYLGLHVRLGDACLYHGVFTLAAAAAALVIAAAVSAPPRWATLVLGTAPLAAIGRMAYGLYLWHFPVFSLLDRFLLRLLPSFHPAPALLWVLKFAGALAVALLSYCYIERPFLRWKGRLSGNRPRKSGAQTRSATIPGPTEPGLNIVGYICSEHGVGESARRSAGAANAANLPFCVCDFTANNPHRTTDLTWAHRRDDRNRHTVNLFHINGDQLPVARTELGASFFAGRYNIGYWHWELPQLPDNWLPGFELLQEVWVPTRFVQDAVSIRSPVPVIRIPHAIDFRPDRNASRADFGLPAHDFLFLVMYDTFSIQARKNPRGALEAFRKAFPETRGVSLVVKISNAASNSAEVQALREEFPEVLILDRGLSRQEAYNLIAVCDSLVSLHRAEGFGLCLAEAMFTGKPVVATDWSGNRDFMNANNSCPVRCSLVPLERDYPPYLRGQVWAEPDLDHAAWYMTRLVRDGAWRQQLGAAARHTMHTEFSPQAVGRLYRERLAAIAPLAGLAPHFAPIAEAA